jgi:hypothetical protein
MLRDGYHQAQTLAVANAHDATGKIRRVANIHGVTSRMDFIQSLKDSIETSVKLILVSSRKAATAAHMSNIDFMQFTLSAARMS